VSETKPSSSPILKCKPLTITFQKKNQRATQHNWKKKQYQWLGVNNQIPMVGIFGSEKFFC